MKRITITLFLGITAGLAWGCGEAPEPDAADDIAVGEFIPDERVVVAPPPATAPRPHAVLEVEGHGEIRIELFPDVAPTSVARFTELVTSGFYEGTTFHRVMPGFMIQGGDPNSRNRDPRDDGRGGSELGDLEDEFSDISHVEGIVAFANTGRPGSGDCQFFVMTGENLDLDGRYSVFGRVVAGQDVATAISLVERDQYGRWGPKDRPRENVVITGARIDPPGVAETPESDASAPDETSVAARESDG